MEKKCLIIMPASDPDGYAKGHLDRVYQYIIAPACKQAGFKPIKASDPTTNDTPWDLIKNIIESEMVICDLSSKNADVSYGFAIRHAMNLPVALMKDVKTRITFDLLEFDHVEYDESLRIDTVQNEIEALSQVLTKSFAFKGETNSLLSHLGIGLAQLSGASIETEVSSSPAPEPLQEEEAPRKEEKPPLPVISPIPDYVGEPISQVEEIDKLKVGDFIFHRNYGKGEIKGINKMAKDKVAKIQFESGSKLLILGTSGIFRKIKE